MLLRQLRGGFLYKSAITNEESSTATARKPRFSFRGIAGLAEKKRHHQRDQRAALSSKPALDFFCQVGKWGFGIPT